MSSMGDPEQGGFRPVSADNVDQRLEWQHQQEERQSMKARPTPKGDEMRPPISKDEIAVKAAEVITRDKRAKFMCIHRGDVNANGIQWYCYIASKRDLHQKTRGHTVIRI